MAKKKQKQTKQPPISAEKYIRTKARFLPIHECLINPDWQEQGLVQVIVSRVHTSGNITFAYYLVDTYCLGVKDSFYQFNYASDSYDEFLKLMRERYEFVSTSYEEVHNLIYGAVEYAEDLGIEPCKEFAVSEYILNEDTDDIPLIEYEYGKDGKPLLITQTMAEADRYIPILDKTIGKDNYEFLIGVDEEDEDYGSYDEDDDEEMHDTYENVNETE